MKIILFILALVLAITLVACDNNQCADEYYGLTRDEIEERFGAADHYGKNFIEYHDGSELTRIHFDKKGIARKSEVEMRGFVDDGDVDEASDVANTPRSLLPETRPDDFKIYFSSAIGAKNIYDTYTGKLQKDLVMNGTSTKEFTPDEETLDEIYRMVRECEINLIDTKMTSENLATEDEMFGMSPLTCYEIIFVANGETYSVKGDATAQAYGNVNDAAKNFTEFCSFMSRLMYDAFDEANMPEAVGGYD